MRNETATGVAGDHLSPTLLFPVPPDGGPIRVPIEVRSVRGLVLDSTTIEVDAMPLAALLATVLPYWQEQGWTLDSVQLPLPGVSPRYTLYLR